MRPRPAPRSPPSLRISRPRISAIQWDCAAEIQDAYGGFAGHPQEGGIERNLTEVRNLSPHIPADVMLGYHFCFGTLGGWPRFTPNDLGQAVKLANAFVAASGRRVDLIHIPVLDRSDDAFFAPLKELKPQGARVYLGLIHNMAGFAARLATARKYWPDFGLGGYCGFGRVPPAELSQILADHLKRSRSPAGPERGSGQRCFGPALVVDLLLDVGAQPLVDAEPDDDEDGGQDQGGRIEHLR